MSDYDVYDSDMPDSGLLERDIELLLSGAPPEDPDLAKLAPIFARTRAAFSVVSLEENAVQFGREAARIADAARPSHPVEATSRSGWSPNSLRRRLLVPAAAAAIFVGLTGAAFAADGSAPDDALYGLDRAFEVVGVFNGGASERIAEAQALFANGQIADAVEHAAQVAGDSPEAAAAAQALHDAAEKLRLNEQGSDNAVETRERVADMLEWMATTDATGKEFGQGVAERAGGLTPGESGQGEGQPDDPGSQGQDPPGGGQGNQGQGGPP